VDDIKMGLKDRDKWRAVLNLGSEIPVSLK
jgi:hypothetical protein